MSTTAAENTKFCLDYHYIEAGVADPTASPGQDGLRGAVYIQVSDFASPTSIAIWQKQDNGLTTAWVNITGGGGGGGVTTVGAIDTPTKSADGAHITGTTIFFQTADGGFPGMLSLTNQNIVGLKSFSNPIGFFGQVGTPPVVGETQLYSDSVTGFLAQEDSSGNVRIVNGIVQDEGTPVVSAPQFLNFVGAGVTAAASGLGATVTIPGESTQTEFRTITGGEAIAKALTLAGTPAVASMTSTAAGGVEQFYGDDYTVAGNVLSWAGLGLDTIGIVAGDKFVIGYNT